MRKSVFDYEMERGGWRFQEERDSKFLGYLFFFVALYLIITLGFIGLFPGHRLAMPVFCSIFCVLPLLIVLMGLIYGSLVGAEYCRDQLIDYLGENGRLSPFTKAVCYIVWVLGAISGLFVLIALIGGCIYILLENIDKIRSGRK